MILVLFQTLSVRCVFRHSSGDFMGAFFAERHQPAMRLAGATRAQARGVTDGRIGSDILFGDLFGAFIAVSQPE